MSQEEITIEDASGATISNRMIVDGLHVPMFFGRDLDTAASIVRNIPNTKIRDDDVMLCTFPKAGTIKSQN